MARRLVQLYLGLVLFGVTCAMLILSGLGNNPWDVLHEGLFAQTGVGTGWWAVILGAVVMVLWIPLRVRPGLGTISNVLVVGLVMEVVLSAFGEADGTAARVALMAGGVLGNGIATGLYIGARFGPGPRDGLMTGLAARGHSVRVVRTAIEATVLLAGVLLGGTVGIGTLLYAIGIGPIVHRTLPYFDVTSRAGGSPRPSSSPPPARRAGGRARRPTPR